MIHILQDKNLVADIFSEEFQSAVPEGAQGDIIAIVEKGQIKAFVMAEQLIRVGLLWVTPEHRNTPQATRLMRELVRFVYHNLPRNTSVITIDSEGDFGELFKKLGMREVEGQVYRKDI
jgi:predicted GNAT family N-acyltransferase